MKNCCSGVKPSIVGAGLVFLRFLECQIGDLRAGQVADAFAQHELAVVMDARLDEVAVELPTTHAVRSWNFFRSSSSTSCRAALGVELRALVVEAVADLVADHHADRAVVHRVARSHANAGGCRMPAGKTISLSSGL